MGLTDEELRDVLARAEEIDRTSRRGQAWNAEVERMIGAAEEVGISRQAVERALSERLDLPAGPPAVGSLAWARSADGKSYVAQVLDVSEDSARVRFLRGSEHTVRLDEIRPCAFLPGVRVVCLWPMWGQWTCTVVGYDAAKQRVKLNDGWGYSRSFPISEVWLAPRVDPEASRRRVYSILLGVGVSVGAVIGAIATALLMR
ncbi:MAG: hypothetical protein ACRENB_07670 [Gemmatimonadales bacterium]